MGCWNKTCGLTNLPIMCGEETYVFVLERVREIRDHCYSTHLYRPLLLPFVSTYNNYGGGENSRGAAFPIIMDAIRKHLVEMSVGKNIVHDIAVTRDAWGEEMFFESVHEKRLKVNYRYDGETEIDFVMMRKDVVDDLASNLEFSQYVGEGQGNEGQGNSYQRYLFANVLADIDAFLDAAVRITHEKKWYLPMMGTLVQHVLERSGTRNWAAEWLRYAQVHHFGNIVRIQDLIVELLMDGKHDLARDLMIEHLRGVFVNDFMESTRKSWIPGSQEGSQSQDYDAYRALMASMNRVMDARDAEYAAEYGDRDEEDEA